jgi:hypothetical protein
MKSRSVFADTKVELPVLSFEAISKNAVQRKRMRPVQWRSFKIA